MSEGQSKIVPHSGVVGLSFLESKDHLWDEAFHPALLVIHRDDLGELERSLPTPARAAGADLVQIVDSRFLIRDQPGKENEDTHTQRDHESRDDEELQSRFAEIEVVVELGRCR